MPQELSESDVFVLLAKRRRRLTLRALQEASTPLKATEIAARIGAREHEHPSAEAIDTIYTALYHNHLPRLEAADVIAYDRDRDTVRPGFNFDILIRVLERVADHDLPWSDA